MKPLSEMLLKIIVELEEAKIAAQRVERWGKTGVLLHPEEKASVQVPKTKEDEENIITMQIDLRLNEPPLDQCMKKLILECYRRKGCRKYATAKAVGMSYPRYMRHCDRLNLTERLDKLAGFHAEHMATNTSVRK